MKKILAIALAMMLMISVFAACGGSSKQPAQDTAPAADGETAAPATDSKDITTVRWMYIGNNVIEDKDVMEKVNEYLAEKIGVKLEMIWKGWGDDFDQPVVLSINGGDDIDIYFTCFWTANEYTQFAKRGAYMRLDDPENNILEQYAPNYFTDLPAGMADGIKTDGADGYGLYAVPATKELAMQYVWELNKPMFDKYELKYEDFNNFYDLEPLLAKVKAGEGASFYPLSADYPVLERMTNGMELVDSYEILGFYFDKTNPSKSEPVIKSHFETPEYKTFIETARDYYQKGYINPASSIELTMNQSWMDARAAGTYLVSNRVAAPAYNLAESAANGYQMDIKDAIAGILSTNGPRGAMHAISTASKNPGKAMQVLDIVNSDVYIHDLLGYGVEGIHYNLENGKVKQTEKKNDFTVWRAGLGQLAMYTPTVDDPENLPKIIADFNDVEVSPLMGWTFDPEPVKNELSALYNIQKEYHLALITGAADPAAKLPEFIDRLKSNGVDKVVEEANRQVQEFLAKK